MTTSFPRGTRLSGIAPPGRPRSCRFASSDGSIVPGCFEDGKDFVLALREPLEGTLTVLEPPVSLDDLREGDSAHAFHYRIETRAGAATRVTIDVSAWQKRKIASCGDFY
jgi:hypothetical protein